MFPFLKEAPKPVVTEEDMKRWRNKAYVTFRTETFHAAVAAGTISPLLPADTLDRWLDRAWLVVNKPLEEGKLKELRIDSRR